MAGTETATERAREGPWRSPAWAARPLPAAPPCAGTRRVRPGRPSPFPLPDALGDRRPPPQGGASTPSPGTEVGALFSTYSVQPGCWFSPCSWLLLLGEAAGWELSTYISSWMMKLPELNVVTLEPRFLNWIGLLIFVPLSFLLEMCRLLFLHYHHHSFCNSIWILPLCCTVTNLTYCLKQIQSPFTSRNKINEVGLRIWDHSH